MPPISDYMRFGELNTDGSIKRDVRICAISGQPTEPGDAMHVVPNTNRFYRVKAPLNWRLSDETKAELEGLVKPNAAPIAEPAADIPAAKGGK